MNKVILCGRLTRDPEIRYTQGERQMAVARFTVAVDRRFSRRAEGTGEQQTADFISCVAFDRQAEFAEKYLKQGSKMLITGRIQTGSYTNKDGQRVYTTDIVVEEFEFAESKASASNAGDSAYSAGNMGGFQQTSRPTPMAASPAISDGFMNIPDGVEDEGLPFN